MKAQSLRSAVAPITQRIGRFFGRFGTPNQYTFLTLLFGIAAGLLVGIHHAYWAVLAFLLSAFFDWVDGAVAKINQQGTRFGIVLDSTVDKITESVLYLGLAWSTMTLFWPAIAAMTAFLWSSYISKVGYEIQTKAQGGIAERRERAILLLIILALLPINERAVIGILYLMAVLSLITAAQRFYWMYRQAQQKNQEKAI